MDAEGGGGGVEGAGGGAGGGENFFVAVWLGYILYRVSFLYRQCGIERTVYAKAGLSLYCKYSNRKGRHLVQGIGLEVMERKNPMTLQVYKYLAKAFLKVTRKSMFLLISFCS